MTARNTRATVSALARDCSVPGAGDLRCAVADCWTTTVSPEGRDVKESHYLRLYQFAIHLPNKHLFLTQLLS